MPKTKKVTITITDEMHQKGNDLSVLVLGSENLQIAGIGHYGEMLDIYDPYLCNEGFVILEGEDPGDEPD